ncbi:MAG: hypothetical protein WCJ58_08115 [bacterium]
MEFQPIPAAPESSRFPNANFQRQQAYTTIAGFGLLVPEYDSFSGMRHRIRKPEEFGSRKF